MSDFNPDAFMAQTVDQPFATERTLCPPGEYRMAVDDFTSEAITITEFEYRRGPNTGKKGKMVKFNCPIIVLDDKVASKLGVDKVVIRQQFILDVDENNQLVFGTNKNIGLGQLRDAVGQNQPGPWGIPNLRNSKPFVGKVIHREYKRDDGTSTTIAEVSRMGALR